jgi:hypothetical protein
MIHNRSRGVNREPALDIALTPGEASLEIHGATRTVGVAPGSLHSPVLTPALERTLSEPASELVLFVLDRGGVALGEWGWPFASPVFLDRPRGSEGRGRLRGTVIRRANALQVLHVPVPESAAFLYFMRSEISAVRPDPGRLVFHREPLALYYFGPEPPPIPPLPGRQPTLEELKRLLKAVPLMPHLVWPPQDAPYDGVLLPPTLLSGDGTAGHHFNVVIVGDGFKTDAEVTEYKRVAGLICAELLKTKPFQARKEVINVWSIPTRSAESGITRCSDPNSHLTYYRSSGCFDGWTDYPGFVGTSQPNIVYDAAWKTLNLGVDQVGVFTVVANCARYGGGAFPAQKLAFVDMCPDDADKTDVAVHECGHVIGLLADEYIGCCPHKHEDVYPNQATIEQVGPPQCLPWIGLAESHELCGGKLAAIHCVVNGVNVPPNPSWIVGKWLGAYWGCQDFDEDASCDLVLCDPYGDLRGQHYFRPMWDCRMRSQYVPFCRVCHAVIDDAICLAAV